MGSQPPAEEGTWLVCIDCGLTPAAFDEVIYHCHGCSGLLEVRYAGFAGCEFFEGRGVWRYAADSILIESKLWTATP